MSGMKEIYDVLDLINDRYDNMSKSQKRIAGYILEY